MSKSHFNIHLPVVEKAGVAYAVMIGSPELEVGEVVSLKEIPTMSFHYDLYLRDLYQGPLLDTPKEYLDALGYAKFSDLRLALVDSARIGIPAEVGITVLVLAEPDIELATEPVAEVIVEEAGVGDLVDVQEDTEEDVWYSDEEEILDIVDDED